MKKLLCALLAVVLCLSLVGCGDKPDAASGGGAGNGNKETVTLKVWGGVPPEAGPQNSIDLFNETFKDKGIQAEYVYYVNDDNGNLKLETTLLAGEGVDVYLSYNASQMSKRIEGNMALDLTELMERDGFDVVEQFGELATQYEYDGIFYCIPTKIDQYGMMLNKDMFDKAGIEIPTEWTYSEFRDIAKRLTTGEGDNKVYGVFLNSQQNIAAAFDYFSVQALGGNWMYNEDGTASGFNDPIIKETAQLVYDLMNTDKSAPTHVDSVTQKLTQEGMFLTGKSAMTIGPWIIRNVKNVESYPHDFVTAFAPYPVPDGGEAKYTQGGVGDLLCINPKSPNIEAAWEYVKWYSTEGMLPVVSGGRVPLCKSFDPAEVTEYFLKGGEELLDADSAKRVLVEPKEVYAMQTITTKSAELGDIFKEEMEAILNGQKSVDDGLADAAARGDKLLSQ